MLGNLSQFRVIYNQSEKETRLGNHVKGGKGEPKSGGLPGRLKEKGTSPFPPQSADAYQEIIAAPPIPLRLSPFQEKDIYVCFLYRGG